MDIIYYYITVRYTVAEPQVFPRSGLVQNITLRFPWLIPARGSNFSDQYYSHLMALLTYDDRADTHTDRSSYA